MAATLIVKNLRALRNVAWSPEGVCALVGPNGAGKSTLLLTLKFLHLSALRGVEESFRRTFGGSYGLRNRTASEDEKIELSLKLGELLWGLELETRGPSISWPVAETFEDPNSPSESWQRGVDSGDLVSSQLIEADDKNYHVVDRIPVGRSSNLAIDLLARTYPTESSGPQRFLSFISNARVFHDPDLWSLRTQGSPTTAGPELDSRSQTAFAVLHTWNSRREHRHRYQFVVEGLQAAFPSACADLDFETAGQTVFARTWAAGSEWPTPIASEANGVLAMLVYLCNIASGEPEGLIALDEPENSLHPFALRELVRAAEAWSEAYATTIVFATHSPVILDALGGQPERVWVMRNDAGDSPNPTRLDRLKNPEWLQHFAFGSLYANGELGSNDDAA